MVSASERHQANRLNLFQLLAGICNYGRDDDLSAEKVLCLEGKCDQ